MSIEDCKVINLPMITDFRGNLSFIEGKVHIPFDIKRIYYLYDIPDGEERGGHAHIELQQLIIAVYGSFDVILNDGFKKKRYRLNNPNCGLYVSPMVWRELNNFSSGSVCLVLASTVYYESDYIRDYTKFLLKVEGERR